MALSSYKTEEYKRIFVLFDSNGDHKLNVPEATDALRSIGLNPTGGKQLIDFNDFCNCIQTQTQTDKTQRAEMIEALKCFDKDGNGLVNVNELVFYLTKMGNEQLTDGDVKELYALADD